MDGSYSKIHSMCYNCLHHLITLLHNPCMHTKLLVNFYFRKPTISYYNSQVAKKIHSKRDSSKNHLILQYIKHKLISIEKEEKEIEKCV